VRVALLSANARAGDAIGHQLAEKLAFFRDAGADVRAFVEDRRRLHPAVRPHCATIDPSRPGGDGWDFLAAADLVIAEYGHAYPMLGLLPLLAGGKPRILIDYHGVTPPELWGAHHRDLLDQGQRQRGLVWCADAALVHSRFTREELTRPTGFPADRVYPAGYVVDGGRWRPGPPRIDLRDRLGLGPATLLLYVGRLAPNKRVPVLVEALAHLRDLSPPVHAAVVGDTDDLYAAEAALCRRRAAELGVADRLHVLGRLSDEQLRDAYRSADVFVMPSRHEGFCIPVIEALACGLPVVAARAGALPETVADAGLTFSPDDAADVARQVRRVLARGTDADIQDQQTGNLRVAIVSYRYGTDFAGGAETSLRTIAEALHRAGHDVEVFTTGVHGEEAESSRQAEDDLEINGIPVRRFRAEPSDPDRRRQAAQAVLEAKGDVPAATEAEFLAHAVQAPDLLAALRGRAGQLDAIITGPYAVGLTHAVARAFPDKTLVLPCFHDEPAAYLRAWGQVYGSAGGLLYHTPEEQDLAQGRLGVNHPRAECCGTFIDMAARGDPQRGRAVVGGARPYVVYCGRYSPQKGLPELFAWARAYAERHPGRFRFAFLGEGGLAVPREPWARDLGFVDEATKRDVLAGAAALVQLSQLESLSLAALEAWAQGAPVLVHRNCEALAGQLRRGGGGRAVATEDEFTAALDDLWDQPERWRALGEQGREYVREHYGSQEAFAARLARTVRALRQPLAERMRQRGLARAAQFDRPRWREQFAAVVDELWHAPARVRRAQVEVSPRSPERTAKAGLSRVLVSVRVANRGTVPAVADGPARTALHCRVLDADGRCCGSAVTPLPALLMPGQALSAAVPVPVPAHAGTYHVAFGAEGKHRPTKERRTPAPALTLTVEEAGRVAEEGCCAALLDSAQAAVAAADRLRCLPVEYPDVTQGRFAALKRWVKRKLLGNFKRAYVDVLSRQQSAFNQRVLAAVQELAECCATLDHARQIGPDNSVTTATLARQLADSRERCRELEARVRRLEALLAVKDQRKEVA
jgi:glycosyltransferase involved in cell wall biosynthesis